MQPVCQPPRATREFNWLPIEALTRKRRRFCTRARRCVCVCREAKSGLTLSLAARGGAYATRGAQVIHQRASIYIFFPLSLTLPAAIFSARDLKKPVGRRDKYPGACMRAALTRKNRPLARKVGKIHLPLAHVCACTCKKFKQLATYASLGSFQKKKNF
jgi:hypothetical protein